MVKVLIVEDEKIIRKGIVNSIDWLALGCTIIGDAEDGEEGLMMIREQKPDLVITDLKMPGLDGIEMLQEAARKYTFHSIILTSYSEFEYAKQAISLNVFEYLLKPIDDYVLENCVKKIIERISDEEKLKKIMERSKNGDHLNPEEFDICIFTGDRCNYYVKETLKRIRNSYDKKISIGTIAEDLRISPSYLSRKFKDETSCTFHHLLNRYRVQKAIELLNEGAYRICEISEMTGFCEYKHFCSVFRKYTNASPSDFMKSGSCVIRKNR